MECLIVEHYTQNKTKQIPCSLYSKLKGHLSVEGISNFAFFFGWDTYTGDLKIQFLTKKLPIFMIQSALKVLSISLYK